MLRPVANYVTSPAGRDEVGIRVVSGVVVTMRGGLNANSATIWAAAGILVVARLANASQVAEDAAHPCL